MKNKLAVLLVVAIGFAATSAFGQSAFTEGVSTAWSDGDNWSTSAVPTAMDDTEVGTLAYNGVNADVSTTTAVAGLVYVGNGDDLGVEVTASLDIGANALLTVDGYVRVGAIGNCTVSMDIQGGLHLTSGGLNFGDGGGYNAGAFPDTFSTVTATIGAGSDIFTFTLPEPNANGYTHGGNINIGQHNWMGRGGNATVVQNGATIDCGGIFYVQEFADRDVLWQINGGTINVGGQNQYAGDYRAFWHIGGTIEITADVEINATLNTHAIFGRNGNGKAAPILKVHTDAVLTVNTTEGQADGDTRFGGMEGGELRQGLELDVSALSIPEGVWVTVIDATSIDDNDRDVSFVAGTPGTWQVQFVDGGRDLVQVMVPEPATLVLLAIGGVAALIRRKR